MEKLLLLVDEYKQHDEWDYVIQADDDDLREAANFDDENNLFAIDGVSITEIEALNKKYIEYLKTEDAETLSDATELQDWIQQFYPRAEVYSLKSYPAVKERLCFESRFAEEFFNLADCDKIQVYEYWDGSNWKQFFPETVTEITVKDEMGIDEWDGRNWQTGGMGLHQSVYKIVEIDGDTQEDKYLVYESTQWQGSHNTAKTMDADELKEHLEENDRLDYFEKITGIVEED